MSAADVEGALSPQGIGHWARSIPWVGAIWTFMRKRPLAGIAGSFVFILVAAAVLADLVSPYGPYERPGEPLAAPSFDFLFGTDQLGRDVFSRVIFGARLSLLIGLSVTLFAGIVGVFLAMVGGYFGGIIDLILNALVDAVLAFPALVIAIALVAALGPATENVVIAVLLPFTARIARVIRSRVLTVAAMPYVDAATSLGASRMRVVLQHVLPNIMAPVIVLLSIFLPAAMLVEAGLSFLGLGPPPPTASWGRMLSEEGQQFYRSAPWLVIWPGMALSVAVIAFNLLGDGLRDHLDPRLRGQE